MKPAEASWSEDTEASAGDLIAVLDATVPVAGVDPAPQAQGPDAAPLPGEDNPERLAATLGLRFRDIGWLRLALTHRSVIHEWPVVVPDQPPPQSNERLEFLGDALLGAIVAEYLYRRYPDAPEGTLTARRVALVRAEQLVSWAREIDLGEYLYLGQGERITESARDRMLAGAFEAVVGAIAVDRGMREMKRFLRHFLERDTERILAGEAAANPKGRLQELLQERYRLAPDYRTVHAEGPAHARVFTAEVSIGGRALAVGTGGSKRDAEQEAARAALAHLAEETMNAVAAVEAGGAEGAPEPGSPGV